MKLVRVKSTNQGRTSHPSWVCGLKLLYVLWSLMRSLVTPFVGVWIETLLIIKKIRHNRVTPFVGVWIETSIRPYRSPRNKKSHPSWVCGLKLNE